VVGYQLFPTSLGGSEPVVEFLGSREPGSVEEFVHCFVVRLLIE
jgi:hypothetical protein